MKTAVEMKQRFIRAGDAIGAFAASPKVRLAAVALAVVMIFAGAVRNSAAALGREAAEREAFEHMTPEQHLAAAHAALREGSTGEVMRQLERVSPAPISHRRPRRCASVPVR